MGIDISLTCISLHHTHAVPTGAREGIMELKLQVVICHVMLETEPWFSGKASSALTTEPSLQFPISTIFKYTVQC